MINVKTVCDQLYTFFKEEHYSIIGPVVFSDGAFRFPRSSKYWGNSLDYIVGITVDGTILFDYDLPPHIVALVGQFFIEYMKGNTK